MNSWACKRNPWRRGENEQILHRHRRRSGLSSCIWRCEEAYLHPVLPTDQIKCFRYLAQRKKIQFKARNTMGRGQWERLGLGTALPVWKPYSKSTTLNLFSLKDFLWTLEGKKKTFHFTAWWWSFALFIYECYQWPFPLFVLVHVLIVLPKVMKSLKILESVSLHLSAHLSSVKKCGESSTYYSSAFLFFYS